MRIRCYIPLIMIILLLSLVQCAYAGTYTYLVTDLSNNYGNTSHNVSDIDIVGINNTHDFSEKLPATVTARYYSGGGGHTQFTLNYTLPDDGSNWQIVGTVTISAFSNSDTGATTLSNQNATIVNINRNTPGTFTGYSLKTATDAANAANTAAGQAKTAADGGKISADTASTRALNAYNSVYNANGNTITAVRDSGGTVLSEARQAKTNAQNAYNTAQTVNTKIDSLTTAVTNIQNTQGVDTSPPEVKITTVSGALATSGSQIRAVVNASDNVSTTFWYSLDGIVYQPLPADGVVNLPVSLSGNNLITLWVKDEAGNVGRNSINIRKL